MPGATARPTCWPRPSTPWPCRSSPWRAESRCRPPRPAGRCLSCPRALDRTVLQPPAHRRIARFEAGKRRMARGKTRGRSRTSGRDPLARLRAICLALPEANEKLSHGEPTWFAGKGKVFAMLDDHHHGAPHLSVWLPAGLGAQEGLIESDPKRYFRPP